MAYKVIMIGCSLGGLRALQTLLAGIKKSVDLPIIIIQHRDSRDVQTAGMLTYILQKSATHTLEEAEDKTPIMPGRVYLAPADYHLLIEEERIILSTELPVAHARPSIDVAFDSGARCYGSSLVGVILTGTGSDGASGLAQIEQRGGLVVIQDPQTAEQPSMPGSAVAACKSPTILPLKSIGPFLCSLQIDGDHLGGTRATG